MKNKKNRTIVALLVLVLILGVGYAVVTGTNLTFNGTATVTDEELKVRYAGSSLANKSKPSGSDADVTTVTETDKVATFSVTDLSYVGDYIEFTYTILNEETDLDATLALGEVTNSNDEYFRFTPTLTNTTVAAGGNTTVKGKVELIKMPISTEQSTATFSVGITATPAAKAAS